MICDILDFRCIIVNELIGNIFLAVIIFAILYFIFASKVKLGFETTVAMAVPFVLFFGMMVSGFQAIYAFVTLFAAIMISLAFLRLIGNK